MMKEFARRHAPYTFYRSLILAFSVVVPSGIAASDLTVSVIGQKYSDGDVIIALFQSAEKNSFPRELSSAICIQKTKTVIEVVRLNCTNVLPGSYALIAFHDSNSNGVIDHSLFGLPKEKFGMSAGCRGKFGPPKFSQCEFTITESLTELLIELK